ncbi:MAG TPA: ABC transporter ATP-binding protein, partial [Terriglobales bacterium]|nr:ABC transporter ATP-binding protein [Terriglobales bacterium]
MATVTFENVSKRYGDVVAVDDFSLDIRDAEFMVLVGPSGCGKTTSLRMIAGLEEITDGTLRIGERIINDIPPKDRDIAMVFQSYALYPHMSIRDNLAFGLRLRHVPKVQIEARVKEAAAILDLTRYLDRKPRELSGGQRQRVALGRAIVREPAVFLMDEPLSNLDAKLRVETRANILRLHQRLNTTFVYVTHDQIEAMTMGTRIAVMNEGRLQQVGTPQELYDRPINRF